MPYRDDWFEFERLHRAAEEGDLLKMKELVLAGCDVNAFDDLSYTPLHYAVGSQQYRAAKWLLEMGANVNANEQERIGETALSLAAQGDYPEMAELLLKHGADPDIPGWMGQIARTRARNRKDEEGRAIAVLIERYVFNKFNPNKRTVR